MSQADLSRATGLAPSTVSNLVQRLVADGALATVRIDGRSTGVKLARGADVAVGVDVGHRHITVAVGSRAGRVLAQRRADIGANSSATVAADLMSDLVREALHEAGMGITEPVGIGLGLPTPIDRANLRIAAPSILPGWVGVDLGDLLSQRLGVAVAVDNDANLGAIAEHHWGAGRGCDSLAYLKLSEGVGAGLIIDGHLYRGRQGIAGEIGHTTMDELGKVCRCGNRGCLETLVAARAVVDLLEPLHGSGLTISDIARLAGLGDVACGRVLSDTGRYVGVAVANLVNVLNPGLIVVGGELAQAGDFLIAPMREVIRRQGIPVATADLNIVTAQLGAVAHAFGAVLLALRHGDAEADSS